MAGPYRIIKRGGETGSFLSVDADGCVGLDCGDDYYSGELDRKDSIALGNALVLCLCGHAVAAHLNDETACNGIGCSCQKFMLDLPCAKLAL